MVDELVNVITVLEVDVLDEVDGKEGDAEDVDADVVMATAVMAFVDELEVVVKAVQELVEIAVTIPIKSENVVSDNVIVTVIVVYR